MSASTPSASCPPRWIVAVTLGAAALPFLPTLSGGFLADDFAYIARFNALPWPEWPKLFLQDWSGGIWGERLRELRPFTALSFMSDARLFGGNPLGYRLTNLALHLLSTWLVVRLAWSYASGAFDSRASAPRSERAGFIAALIGGLIFALHPAHAEAVTWITGRVDLQATAAALLFLLAAESFAARGGKGCALIAWAAFFVGVFSKEFCLFAPLLLALRWLLTDVGAPRETWLRRLLLVVGVVVLVALYAAARRAAFGHDAIGYNLWTDEPAWQRQTHYLGWLVPLLPFHPHTEWQSFPSLSALHALWIAFAIGVAGALGFASWKRAHRAATALFFLGIWYFVTVLPFLAVVYFSPRHLYFPTVGFALGFGLLAALLSRGLTIGLIVVAGIGAGLWPAIAPWRRTAAVSRDALAAINAHLIAPENDLVLISSVPETMGRTLLWAWSSPACFQAPFVAHPPSKLIERPGNATRSNRWLEERLPAETVRAAGGAFVLVVDSTGGIRTRRLSRAELEPHIEPLARQVAEQRLTPEAWSEWVHALFKP